MQTHILSVMDTYEGFHGTSAECVDQIKANNFNISNNPCEWMGAGIYFFIEGIGGDPRGLAKNFASYRGHCSGFAHYSILQANISADNGNILDLRTNDGLDAYNMVRTYLINRCRDQFPRNRDLDEDNCTIHDMVKKHMGLDIVIQNLYIKQYTDRILQIRSLVPNVTVLCATSADIVDKDSIEEIESGERT